MSYNGYNNANSYSPYYQQTSDQAGRAQYQGQSRNIAVPQNGSYQPLNTYQQQAQSFAPQAASISAHENHGYGDSNASRTRLQDSRSNQAHSGPSADTSALGNLAYASSLRRENPSLQQIADYNRAQNTASYGNGTSFGSIFTASVEHGAGHGRTDCRGSSREATSARSQAALRGTSFNHTSSNGQSGHQGHQTGAVGYGQLQAQHTAPQATRLSTLNRYTSQPPRPTSGQAVKHPVSRNGSQSLQSPTIRAHQAGSNQLRGDSGDIRGSGQNMVQSPLQQAHHNSSALTGYRSETSMQKAQNQQATQVPAGAADRSQKLFQPSLSHSPPARNVQNSPAVDTHVNGANSRTTMPIENPYPLTVDPSQVFNHYEYSRKQAEAEAVRKKAAEARQAAAQPKSTPQEVIGAPSSSDINHEIAKKNQMELEMKQMIEKMRDYKSKDPSLFSQIWEQVKKVNITHSLHT